MISTKSNITPLDQQPLYFPASVVELDKYSEEQLQHALNTKLRRKAEQMQKENETDELRLAQRRISLRELLKVLEPTESQNITSGEVIAAAVKFLTGRTDGAAAREIAENRGFPVGPVAEILRDEAARQDGKVRREGKAKGTRYFLS